MHSLKIWVSWNDNDTITNVLNHLYYRPINQISASRSKDNISIDPKVTLKRRLKKWDGEALRQSKISNRRVVELLMLRSGGPRTFMHQTLIDDLVKRKKMNIPVDNILKSMIERYRYDSIFLLDDEDKQLKNNFEEQGYNPIIVPDSLGIDQISDFILSETLKLHWHQE